MYRHLAVKLNRNLSELSQNSLDFLNFRESLSEFSQNSLKLGTFQVMSLIMLKNIFSVQTIASEIYFVFCGNRLSLLGRKPLPPGFSVCSVSTGVFVYFLRWSCFSIFIYIMIGTCLISTMFERINHYFDIT